MDGGVPPPVRQARFVADLHLTLVRNENAYYCCIAQLCTSLPLPLPAHAPLLYFAGDSHSLPPAWRSLSWRGKQHLLRPVLVTGLKTWHLRPASEFYPKANFEAAMKIIPDGAPVVCAPPPPPPQRASERARPPPHPPPPDNNPPSPACHETHALAPR